MSPGRLGEPIATVLAIRTDRERRHVRRAGRINPSDTGTAASSRQISC
jgi:hypothetical protein